MNLIKSAVLVATFVIVTGVASSTTLRNIEEIQPVGDQAIDITGEIDFNDNPLGNISSLENCGTNQFLNGDGQCITEQYSPDSTVVQSLSISGNTVTLSDGGGSVTVPDDQNIQSFSGSGDTVTLDLENGGTASASIQDNYEANTNTNSATECSGRYTFLAGDSGCEDFTTNTASFINGDLVETNSLDSSELSDSITIPDQLVVPVR